MNLREQVIGKLKMLKRSFQQPELQKWPQMPYRTLDFVYWRPRGYVNFGDELGRTVAELMLARRGITVFDEVSTQRRLLTVGSILHYAQSGDDIWGTGRNGREADSRHEFTQLNVHAVRGPRTHEFLKKMGIVAPEVFGDPGLLIPHLTGGRFVVKERQGIAFVPNLNDPIAGLNYTKYGVKLIDPRGSWNKTIQEILRHQFILSSSLHGLILAEAFGIPARYVRLTEKEDIFKYEDYYEGTNRYGVQYATSVQEGLRLGGVDLPDFDPSRLMEAFPYEIWFGTEA